MDVVIRYKFAGKIIRHTTKTSVETDFFLKTLKEMGIEVVSIQRILVLE